MAAVRIELDRDGIRSLLASDDVQRMLDDKANAVARAAQRVGIMVDGNPGEIALPITTASSGNSTRARALVIVDHPSGLAVESKHRLLVGSLDAAR